MKKYCFSILLILTFCFNLIHTERQRVKFKTVLQNHENRSYSIEENSKKDQDKSEPNDIIKVLVAIDIKNYAYSLPTFLATLETLKCPSSTKKCDLW
jgi:hypothetical protein